jgi:hypothetical protein
MKFSKFLQETIVKRGQKFVVMNRNKTEVLGTHRTKKEAGKQLAAIEISKSKKS